MDKEQEARSRVELIVFHIPCYYLKSDVRVRIQSQLLWLGGVCVLQIEDVVDMGSLSTDFWARAKGSTEARGKSGRPSPMWNHHI